MERYATEGQLAHIIQLVSQSLIPPIYQETLLNSLHALTEDDATRIERDLDDLRRQLTTYETAAIVWLETWRTIAQRIEGRLRREVMLIEHEVDELLMKSA